MKQAPLFIGVDGGGTGCRARIEDGEGNVLGAGMAGPATTRLGIEASIASVMTACRAALEEAGLPETAFAGMAAGIGLAGMGRKGAREAFAAWDKPFARATFVTDGEIACIGAHGGQDGGIVIIGTGSFGLGFIGAQEIRVGGYGFPISDEGSGAELGLNAVRLALRAHDGRIQGSPLLTDVMARFSNDPQEAVAWMDKATATDYATFAPLVMRHANQGDPVGRTIVQGGAAEIDAMIRTLIAGGVPRIALIGGLATAMEEWLAPDVRRRLTPVLGDAVSGAIILARRVPA